MQCSANRAGAEWLGLEAAEPLFLCFVRALNGEWCRGVVSGMALIVERVVTAAVAVDAVFAAKGQYRRFKAQSACLVLFRVCNEAVLESMAEALNGARSAVKVLALCCAAIF